MFSKYDLHEAMNLRVGELPFEKPITPTDMRIGLARAQYYSTVIRNVRMMAEREGWNGEDTMTAIAFYTTLRLEVAQQSLHYFYAKSASPICMLKTESTYRPENGACDPKPMTATEVLQRQREFRGEKAAEDIFPPK